MNKLLLLCFFKKNAKKIKRLLQKLFRRELYYVGSTDILPEPLSKEEEIKSAQKLLIKRAIYAIAIFFVVLIVTFVFNTLSTMPIK